MGKVEIEQRGSVLLATLDNPPHGFMDEGTVDGLDTLVARAEEDDSVRGVVLTGSHPERFVAHYDVAEILAGADEAPAVGRRAAAASLSATRALGKVPGVEGRLAASQVAGLVALERFHSIFLRMNRCGVVFIAAINGSTQGGGCELSLACDLRLMARGDHVIGQPEILLGFPPGGGGTQRLARLLGSGRALRVALDGTPISGETALELGLVDELVDGDELVDRAVAEAARLGSRSRAATAAVKRAIYEGGSLPLPAGIRVEQVEFMAAVGTPEARSAMRAYVEELERTGEPPAYDRERMAEIDREGLGAG